MWTHFNNFPTISTWATYITLQLYIIIQLYELNICYLYKVTSLNNLVHPLYQYRIITISITYFITRPINGHIYQYNQQHGSSVDSQHGNFMQYDPLTCLFPNDPTLQLKRVKQHTFKLYTKVQLKEYNFISMFSIKKEQYLSLIKKNMSIRNEHQLTNSHYTIISLRSLRSIR